MSFSRVVGQSAAVETLRRALRTGRIAHAYLFAGPRGIGKMTAAIEFAAAMVCQRASDDGCGECPACQKVMRGTHPDVHRLEPEGAGRQVRVDPVREEVIAAMGLKPNEARHTVVLIDDAHAMNDHSQGCLLKTLEEPPQGAVIVLVTPRPDDLQETILSRCQAIRFFPLAPGLIRRKLEEDGVGPKQADFLARISGGSLGRAVQMLGEADIAQSRIDVLAIATGLTERNIISSAAQFSKIADKFSTSRSEARTTTEWLLDFIALFYRDVMLRQLGADNSLLLNPDVAVQVESETSITPRAIRAILDTIEEAKLLVSTHVSPESAVVDAFSKIAFYRSRRVA